MAETALHITTTSDDAAVQSFANKLNTSNMTLKDFNKSARELKQGLTVGSQGMKDFGDIMVQVSAQSKSLTMQQNSLTNVIKDSRREHRLYMFAVMESLRTLDGLTGKNKEMTDAVRGGAEAFFGMKFAMDMMGESMAAFSTPAAVVVGLLAVFGQIASANAKRMEEFNTALDKQMELMRSLGTMTDTMYLKMLNRELEIAKEEQKTAGGASWGVFWAALTGGNQGMQQARLNAILEAGNKVLELQQKIDKVSKDINKTYDTTISSLDKWLSDYQEQVNAYNKGLDDRIEREQKINDKLKDRLDYAAGKRGKAAEARQKAGTAYVSVIGMEGEEVGKENLKPFQEVEKMTFQNIARDLKSIVGTAMDEIFGHKPQSLFQIMVVDFAEALTEMETRALGSILFNLITTGGTGGVKSILGSIFHFAGGGTLNEPVIGRGMASGRTYTFAERGPEYIVPQSGGGMNSVANEVGALTSFLANHLTTPDGALFVLKSAGNVRKFGKTF